jgi:hypothetical protein
MNSSSNKMTEVVVGAGLHVAADEDDKAVEQAPLNNGGAVDERAEDGSTPLY